jgi:hypothetical protein
MTRVCSTEPTRTCVGCRERRSAHQMVRCVVRHGGLVSAGSAGRGAWVCSIECFDRAVPAGFARAWRRTIDRDGLRDLREPVREVLSTKVVSATGVSMNGVMTNDVTTVKDCD